MKRQTEAQRARQVTQFEADWSALEVIAVDEPLVRRAGELAERFELRGCDSVHLAAAEIIWRQVADNFCLAAFDHRFVSAAEAMGMAVSEQS